MPEIGDPAPDFMLLDGEGTTVRHSGLYGKQVVLYFYPRDLTPGCTEQDCDFRDRHAELAAAGAVVLGVSPDSDKSHRKFAGRHSLPFALLVDADTAVAAAYEVWKEKSMYGRTFMGIERLTFLIDPEGRIARIWPRVKDAGHGQDVLLAVSASYPSATDAEFSLQLDYAQGCLEPATIQGPWARRVQLLRTAIPAGSRLGITLSGTRSRAWSQPGLLPRIIFRPFREVSCSAHPAFLPCPGMRAAPGAIRGPPLFAGVGAL